MILTPDLNWESRGLAGLEAAERPLPAGLTGLNVRLSGIQILDIKRGFFNPRPDADIYPLFLVATSGVETPITLLPLQVFNDIAPGDQLPLPNIAAPTIFRTGETLPAWIDVHVLVMKSRKAQRDLAAGITAALSSTEGKAIQTAITTSLSAANPAVGVVANLAVGLLNLACGFIAKGEDTQLFYSHASIERADAYCIDQPIVLTDEKHARVELLVQARV